MTICVCADTTFCKNFRDNNWHLVNSEEIILIFFSIEHSVGVSLPPYFGIKFPNNVGENIRFSVKSKDL